jgi:TctA family transporter
MTAVFAWGDIAAALAGALAGGVAACLPGVHVTLVAALAAAIAASGAVSPSFLWPFAAASVGAYAILNGLPAAFLDAPDDSAAFSDGAIGRYSDAGWSRQAFLLTVMGGVAALIVQCGLFLAMPSSSLVRASWLLSPAAQGLLWVGAIMAAASPAPPDPGPPATGRSAARAAGGVALFAACGLLGLAVHEAGDGRIGSAMLLLPCWAGLFTVPGLLTALLLPRRPSAAPPPVSLGPLAPRDVVRGVAAGLAAGAVVCVPGITPAAAGAVAARLAGLSDRVRLVALGAAKAGALTLGPLLAAAAGARILRGTAVVVPLPHAVAGGGAAQATVQTVFALLLGGGLAVALAGAASQAAERIALRRRCAAAVSLGLVAVVAAAACGGVGLLVLAASTGLGLVPSLFGLGRAGLLGAVLVPALVRTAGWGAFR